MSRESGGSWSLAAASRNCEQKPVYVHTLCPSPCHVHVCPPQVLLPQRIPAAVAPSLLMSPMVFTQPTWAPPQERFSGLLPPGSQDPVATPSGLLLPLQTPEPPGTPSSPLTKLQLQEALLHLIQVGAPPSCSSC